MSLSRAASVLFLALAACGGATTSSSEGAEEQKPTTAPTPETSPTKTPAPTPPFVQDPSSTISFTASTIVARRDASSAPCGQKNLVFSPLDTFTLQVVGTSSKSPSFTSIAISHGATVEVGAPIDLSPEKPNQYGTQQGQSGRGAADVSLTLFGDRASDSKPLETPFDRATVTILELPKQEGAPLAARVQLHFTSGDTLDISLSAKVESDTGPCAAGTDG